MGHSAEAWGLARACRLLVLLARVFGQQAGDVHLVCSVFVRPEKEYLLLLEFVVDSGALDQNVQNGVQVFGEGTVFQVVLPVVDVDHPLAAILGDVFVLLLLGLGQILVFVEEFAAVGVLRAVSGFYDADAAAGDITEADVESAADVVEHEVHSLRHFLEAGGVQQAAHVQSERICAAGRQEYVGGFDGPVKQLKLSEDFPVFEGWDI